jgi:hypothetical protein
VRQGDPYNVSRDLPREARFAATAAGRHIDYPPAVADRLDIGQRRYGDRWTTRPLTALLAEADEEALDLGAWSTLAHLQSDEADLTPSDQSRLELALHKATRAAAEAHAQLTVAMSIATHRHIEPHASALDLAIDVIETNLPPDRAWHPSAPIVAAGADAHVNPRTMQRAMGRLGIEHRRLREFQAGTEWRWPTKHRPVATNHATPLNGERSR